MAFADNVKQLPGVAHLAAIELADDEGGLVTLQNRHGQSGMLAVINHLAQTYGAITPQAAALGLELFAEHTEAARSDPGKHPHVEVLLRVVASGRRLRVKHVFALGAD